jgi:hypothetical protein
MHMRTIVAVVLACVALCAAPLAQSQSAAEWRDVVVPPYPGGVRELGGSCIGQGTSGDAMCAVSVAVLKDEQSGTRTVVAVRRLHHVDGSPVGGDKPLGLVTDAVEPEALDDARNDVAIGLCQRDAQPDSRIVAVMRPDANTEWYTRFDGVWRLDDAGRFQPIAPAGVRCLNEGYGYEG